MIEQKISIKKGLGNLQFGIDIDEMVKLLGQPDHIEEFEAFDNGTSMAYMYDQLNLVAFFEGIDNKVLTILETKDPAAVLFDRKVFEMDEFQIQDLMINQGFKEIDAENLPWGGKRISFEDANIDFYYEDDKLTAINWGIFPPAED
jgi:hypothetical protein